MTFIQAAIETIKAEKNLPMSAKEIWSKISDKVDTKGKTPYASLNTIMLHNSINSNLSKRKGKDIFETIGKNPIKFRLLNFSENTKFIEEETQAERILLYEITNLELNWNKLSVYNNNDTIEYEISDCEEYTYIIEDIAHATIKIGKTKNDPTQRLNQLKTANPSINLKHVFPSSQWSESDLHLKFEDFRKDLEWFFYTKGLKEFLSEEIKKHNLILRSYDKKIDLEKVEKEMTILF